MYSIKALKNRKGEAKGARSKSEAMNGLKNGLNYHERKVYVLRMRRLRRNYVYIIFNSLSGHLVLGGKMSSQMRITGGQGYQN